MVYETQVLNGGKFLDNKIAPLEINLTKKIAGMQESTSLKPLLLVPGTWNLISNYLDITEAATGGVL